jgi:hypothetical protein
MNGVIKKHEKKKLQTKYSRENVASVNEAKGREEVERNITCEYTSGTANDFLETCSKARSSTLPLCRERR